MKVTLSDILVVENNMIFTKKEIDRHEFVMRVNSLNASITDERKKCDSDYNDTLHEQWYDFVDRLCYIYFDLESHKGIHPESLSGKDYIENNFTDYIKMVSELTSKYKWINLFIKEKFPEK